MHVKPALVSLYLQVLILLCDVYSNKCSKNTDIIFVWFSILKKSKHLEMAFKKKIRRLTMTTRIWKSFWTSENKLIKSHSEPNSKSELIRVKRWNFRQAMSSFPSKTHQVIVKWSTIWIWWDATKLLWSNLLFDEMP